MVVLFLIFSYYRSKFPGGALQSQKVNTLMTVINLAILLLLGKVPLAHPQQRLRQSVCFPTASPESVWTFAPLIRMGHRFCLCPVYHSMTWFGDNTLTQTYATQGRRAAAATYLPDGLSECNLCILEMHSHMFFFALSFSPIGVSSGKKIL